MSITITINGTDAKEALQELAVFAIGVSGKEPAVAEPVKTTKSTTKKEKPPVETTEPETAPEEAPAEESVSVEEVRALAKELTGKGKRAEVQAVIVAAGYKNLSSVKAADLSTIKTELEKL